MNLLDSLAAYVSPDDIDLSRADFLHTVANRILDDLGWQNHERECRQAAEAVLAERKRRVTTKRGAR